MSIPSDIRLFWEDQQSINPDSELNYPDPNYGLEPVPSKRQRLEPAADAHKVSEYFQGHQDQLILMESKDRYFLTRKIVAVADKSNDPVVQLFANQIINLVGKAGFQQAINEGDYQLAFEILNKLPGQDYPDVELILSNHLQSGIFVDGNLFELTVKAQLTISSDSNNLINLLDRYMLFLDPIDDLCYLLVVINKDRFSEELFNQIVPKGNISLKNFLENDELKILQGADHKQAIQYLVESNRNRLHNFDRMDREHKIFVSLIQPQHFASDFKPTEEFLKVRYELLTKNLYLKTLQILKNETINQFLIDESYLYASNGRYDEALELCKTCEMSDSSIFYNLSIPAIYQSKFFRFGFNFDSIFFEKASPSTIQFALPILLPNLEVNSIFTYFKNKQFSLEVCYQLYGYIINGPTFNFIHNLILMDKNSPPEVAVAIINRFSFDLGSEQLRECLLSHIESYKWDVELLTLCLGPMSLSDQMFYSIINHPSFRSGDLFILRLLLSNLPTLMEVDVQFDKVTNLIQEGVLFNGLSLNALVDIYMLNPFLKDLDGHSLLHAIVKKVGTLEKLFEVIKFEDVFLSSELDDSLKPLDYLDPSRLEFTPEVKDLLKQTTFSNLFTEKIFFLMTYLKSPDLFVHWGQMEPQFLQLFLQDPLGPHPIETTSRFIVQLTNEEIYRLTKLEVVAPGIDKMSIINYLDDYTRVLIDRSHPLFFSPIKCDLQDTVLMIESFLKYNPNAIVKTKYNNNILHYLFSLREYWFYRLGYSEEGIFEGFLLTNTNLVPLIFEKNDSGVSPFDLMIKSKINLNFNIINLLKGLASKEQAISLFFCYFQYYPLDQLVDVFPEYVISMVHIFLKDGYINEASLILNHLISNNNLKEVLDKASVEDILGVLSSLEYDKEMEFVFKDQVRNEILLNTDLDPSQKTQRGRYVLYELINLGNKQFLDKVINNIHFIMDNFSLTSLVKLYNYVEDEDLKLHILERLAQALKDPLNAAAFGSSADVESVFLIYTNKLSFCEYPLDEDFPLYLLTYQVDYQYTQIPIPEIVIPPSEHPDNIGEIIDLFNANIIEKPLPYIPRDDDKTVLTTQVLLTRLQNLVSFIEQETPYTSVPSIDEEKKLYYKELRDALSWVVDLIKKEKDLDKIQSALVDIATGGPEGHCGSRWIHDVKAHYAILNNIVIVETGEGALLRHLSLVRGEDVYTMVKKRDYNIHYKNKLEFIIAKDRGIPQTGTPMDDSLGGTIIPALAFLEFDSLHNEARVFNAVLSYINDPFSTLEKRANLEEWLKAFGEADPRYPWVVEVPDSEEVRELREGLDEHLSQIEYQLSIPFEQSSNFKKFDRLIGGIDWKKISFEEFLKENNLPIKKSKLEQIKTIQTAIVHQKEEGTLFTDFINWFFDQSSQRTPRTQMREFSQEIDLRDSIIGFCQNDLTLFQTFISALVSKDGTVFMSQIIPKLKHRDEFKKVKDLLQFYNISDVSIEDFLKDRNYQKLRQILNEAFLTTKRNEYLGTLFETDAEGEVIIFEEFNKTIPHYKPTVALEILRRMNVLIHDKDL